MKPILALDCAKSALPLPGKARAVQRARWWLRKALHGIFFIAGRQKSDPGTDFSDANIAQAQVIGEALQKASGKQLDALIEDGVLKEICNGCQEN